MADTEEQGPSNPPSPRPNPFLYPNITREVLRYLSTKDLKSSRLVSRDWEMEAYLHIRGKYKVVLSHYIRVKEYVNFLGHRRDFADTFVIGPGLNIDTPLTGQFFTDFGPNIRTLSLHKSKWKEPQLRELLFHKLPNLENLTLACLVPKGNDRGHFFQEKVAGDPETMRVLPNLKALSLNVQAWESTFDFRFYPTVSTFLIDFFLVAPALETVSCPRPDYHPLGFLFRVNPIQVNLFINSEAVDALDEANGMGVESNIRRVLFDTLKSADARIPKLTKLSELDICMTLREEHIRQLMIKAYELRALDMIVTQNVTMVTLHNFLGILKRSLKHLSLRFLQGSSCTLEFPSGPELSSLETLTITGFTGSLGFVRHLSRLEKLVVIKIPSLSVVFPLPNHFDFDQPLEHVKTFEVYEEELRGGVTFRPLFVTVVATNFPNLRRLRLDNICDGTLRTIYVCLPALEVLIARNGNFTDSGLTGIPLELCKNIQHIGNYENLRQGSREGQSIASLRNLRELELNSRTLSDVGIVYGVAQCASLRRLTLMAYNITDVSVRKIADEMGRLEFLKTELCYQLTLSVLDYAAEKLRGAEVTINEYEGPMKSMEMWKFLKRNKNVKVHVPKITEPEVEEYRLNLKRKKAVPSSSAQAGCSYSAASSSSSSR